jgi:hypothetical protein
MTKPEVSTTFPLIVYPGMRDVGASVVLEYHVPST